jgi:signal peptidase I
VVDFQGMLAKRAAAEQRAHLAREVIETVLLTALIFGVVHFSVQTFWVQGPSMQPGLQDNEYLLVNSLAYVFGQPSRGDVIVFHHHHIPIGPQGAGQGCSVESGGTLETCDYVKRVIGVPGDTITINATQVIVDGVVLTEPYVQIPSGVAENNVVLPPEKLQPHQFFVMGDNRLNSSDSRDWGPVDRSDIIGRAVMVFWPLSTLHWLPNYSYVFAQVKA